MLSEVFGNFSQVFWISAQLPQIWKNHRSKSVEGLSLPFLLNWLCGDFTNLIGCIFTHQLNFQRNLAIYFNLIDLVLIGQFILYSKPTTCNLEPEQDITQPDQPQSHPSLNNLQSNSIISKLRLANPTSINHSISDETTKNSSVQLPSDHSNPSQDSNENLGTLPSITATTQPARSLQALRSFSLKTTLFLLAILGFIIFEATTTQNLFSSIHAHSSTLLRTRPFSNPTNDSHNPKSSKILHRIKRKTSLFTPSNSNDKSPAEEGGSITQRIGTVSAWLCALLYLTSRLPQIYKNYSRKSVEGLSILLFILAFLGNLTYVCSILTSPQFVGGRGEEDKLRYLKESVPYLIGSGGTLCFDFTIFTQSWIYRTPHVPPLVNPYRRLSNASDSSSQSSSCSNSIMNL